MRSKRPDRCLVVIFSSLLLWYGLGRNGPNQSQTQSYQDGFFYGSQSTNEATQTHTGATHIMCVRSAMDNVNIADDYGDTFVQWQQGCIAGAKQQLLPYTTKGVEADQNGHVVP